MPTFEELARRAQGLTQLTPPMPLAVQWASDRVHELLGKRRVAIYKRNLELSIPGPLTSGTVTIARGQRAVVGNAAAQTAWASLDASFPDGWFMRPRAAWYRIAGRTGTSITLESAYAEADVAAVTYTLAKHYHTLPASVSQLDEASFVLPRLGQPLEFLSETLLTLRYPNRWGISFGGMSLPHAIAEVEPAASGARQVELYPFSNQSELVTYAAYVDPPPFTYDASLPLGLDMHHLLPGLMADFYAWGAEGVQEAQVKGLMLNEKARCLTRFASAKEQALQHLESNRIMGFVLMTQRRRGWSSGGITTAYDEVWSRP